MKKIMALVLALALLLSLNIGTMSAVAEKEPITITLFHRYVDANIGISTEDTALLPMLRKFQEDYAGKVEIVEEQMQTNEYATKYKVLAAANDLPDVFNIAGSDLDNLLAGGVLSPLNDDLDKNPEFRDGFRPGQFDCGTREGLIYGVPIACGPTHLFYYNADMYAEAGYETFPDNWDDLFQCWENLKAMGVTPIAMGNKTGSAAEYAWMSTLSDRINGSDWTLSICDGTGARFTDEGFVRALSVLNDIAQKGYFNKDVNSVEGSVALSYYLNGDAATFVDGIWNVATIVETAPAEILEVTHTAVMPGFEDGKGNPLNSAGGAGWYYSLNSNLEAGEKRDMCVELLKYLVGEDTAAAMAGMGGYPAYDPGDFDRTNLHPLAAEAYDRCSLADASRIYDLWLDSSVCEVFNTSIQEMLAGSRTPEKTAETINRVYEDYLLMSGKGN